MRRASTLLLGSTLALVAAAPAAAAEVEVKAIDSPATWDKPQVTVTAGDTVRWTFAGTQQPHNVASNSPNWQYRTEYGVPAPPGAYTFATPGVYDFVCEVHATTMTGRVTVTDESGNPPDPPDPPGPGEQPFPNPSDFPGELETGGLDTERPELHGVRMKGVRRGARVRFRVSERARVTLRVMRRGIPVKTKHVRAAKRRRTVTIRGLRRGRYRVVLRAVDPAGNRSRAVSRRVRFR
jgi:plastocyanin